MTKDGRIILLFFAYCEISDIFAGPTKVSPVVVEGLVSFP